jgi:Uma2 family endonuclease
METVPAPKQWTDEELMSLTDVEGKCELVNGELIVAATGVRHDRLVMRLGGELEQFSREQGLGILQGSDTGYKMANGNVRCPDISFISAARARRYVEEDRDVFFDGAPDLAVEILSPSDTLRRTKQKVLEYFANGCRLAWILDPTHKTILVMEPNGSERLLGADDSVDGGEVVPGFSVSVSEVFRKPTLRSGPPESGE